MTVEYDKRMYTLVQIHSEMNFDIYLSSVSLVIIYLSIYLSSIYYLSIIYLYISIIYLSSIYLSVSINHLSI